jgi:hypothetical protein
MRCGRNTPGNGLSFVLKFSYTSLAFPVNLHTILGISREHGMSSLARPSDVLLPIKQRKYFTLK